MCIFVLIFFQIECTDEELLLEDISLDDSAFEYSPCLNPWVKLLIFDSLLVNVILLFLGDNSKSYIVNMFKFSVCKN